MMRHYKFFVILLPLTFSMAVILSQAGFCADCANLDEVCSIKEESTFPPCCPRDRVTNVQLKCKAESEDIGTCVEKKE